MLVRAFSKSVSERHCAGFDGKFWTAGHRVEPTSEAFVWKVLTPNGYRHLPMNYSNWRDWQPDNYKPSIDSEDESCVHTNRYFEWNDKRCSAEVRYVCEYETLMPFGFTGDGHNCSGNIVQPVNFNK